MTSILAKAYPTAVEPTPPEKLGPLSIEKQLSPTDDSFDFGERVVVSKEMERKILMKTDIRVIPILFLLFLVSFIDRSNIGNAKILGLTDGLHMTGNQYNIAVLVFNITYILFDIPSNLLLRKSRPNVMMSLMMFSWGKYYL